MEVSDSAEAKESKTAKVILIMFFNVRSITHSKF